MSIKSEFPVDTEFSITFVIQDHKSKRPHYDLRIIKRGSDKAYSWAIPKHRIPKKNEKLLAVPTEVHTKSAALFEGEYTEGYGKGKVDIHSKKSMRATYNGKSITFWDDKVKYRLIPFIDGMWFWTTL